jgi:hypothetical protein
MHSSVDLKFRAYVIRLALIAMAGVGCNVSSRGTQASATLQPEFTDRSILSDVPCPAPCWYGLHLDETGKTEALNQVQGLSFVDPTILTETAIHYALLEDSIQRSVVGSSIRIMCKSPKGWTCATLVFVDDVLVQVVLLPNYQLTFGQLVAHLGDPDYLQIVPDSSHGPLCDLALIWRQKGVRAAFISGSDDSTESRCTEVREVLQVEDWLPAHQIMYMLPDNIALASIPESGRDFVWSGFVDQ